MGESTSDYLVGVMAPPVAVVLGFAALLAALVWQFRTRRYRAWTYWSAVVGVGVFGTMAADVVHVALGVPYTVSSLFYAAVLLAVFATWRSTEGTLSVHSIDTPRREAFYWAAVMATFAMGTALGDFTAYSLNLGYGSSVVLFAGLMAIPAIGRLWLGWGAVPTFWTAYVLTRPLGASVADGLAKPGRDGGLGLGDGPVALVLTLLIAATVAYLAASRSDVQPEPEPVLDRAGV
ncbi:MAG: hypothetical protein HOY69_33370 [Streptomyces sp.]|nr:hypothetical protein [Streptomyces sp.]